MSITVVGSMALDHLETPFGKVQNVLGGAASHFSVSASFFTKVQTVAVVGEDFPTEHFEFFKSRGIDLSGVDVVKGGKTFHWSGRYGFDMNSAQTLDTQLNVFETFRPKLPESFCNPQILFLANIDPDLQRHVIEQAGKPDWIVLDSMNYWIDTKKDSLIQTIKRVNAVTINEAEIRSLTQQSNLIKAAKAVQAFGPKAVIIKRGEYGSLLFVGDDFFAAPALPLEDIIDPTGAGDTFAGGMWGYLDRTKDFSFDNLKTAMICGSVMASFEVEKFSCDRMRTLDMNQISQRFMQFETLGQFDRMKV